MEKLKHRVVISFLVFLLVCLVHFFGKNRSLTVGGDGLHEKITYNWHNAIKPSSTFPYIVISRKYTGMKMGDPNASYNCHDYQFTGDNQAKFSVQWDETFCQTKGTCACEVIHVSGVDRLAPFPDMYSVFNSVSLNEKGEVIAQVVDGNGFMVHLGEDKKPEFIVEFVDFKGAAISVIDWKAKTQKQRVF